MNITLSFRNSFTQQFNSERHEMSDNNVSKPISIPAILKGIKFSIQRYYTHENYISELT